MQKNHWTNQYREWTDFARDIAIASGDIICQYFRKPLDYMSKDDLSPVTLADQQVEQFLRKKIEEKYPNHGIIGEEYGIKDPEKSVQWVIDPIDGTKAFIAGIPLFGTLIGIIHDGIPVGGVIYQPISHECWSGYQGGSATLNGITIVSKQTEFDLSKTIIGSTYPHFFDHGEDSEPFKRLQQSVHFTRFGLDCYAAGLIACGQIDFMVETRLQLYDFAALDPIIQSAGGMVSDWAGNPLTLDCLKTTNPKGHFLASANKHLHEQALTLLKS